MRCLLIKGPAVGMPEHYSPEQWAEIWPRVQINTAQELKVSAQFCGKFHNIWISAVHKSCHCFFAPLSTLVPKLLPHAILGYLSYQQFRKSWSKMAENGLKCISNTTLSFIVIEDHFQVKIQWSRRLQQGQSARGVLLYLHIVFRETSLTPLVWVVVAESLPLPLAILLHH